MHPVLFFESFFCCSRDDLERLQPLSQSLLDIIVNGSTVLPLRPIYGVNMGYDEDAQDKIHIFVKEPASLFEPESDYVASLLDGDFKETFRRLQHICIKEFRVRIRDSPFLRYWKAEETAAFSVVNIRFARPITADYDLLDSIVNHLRPKITQVDAVGSSWGGNGYDSREHTELLARASFLNNLQTCRLEVFHDGFPPPTFFLNEPGYPNYKLRGYGANLADGIDRFLESFVRDGCANKKFESVCVEWNVRKGEQAPAPKQFRKPTKSDVPLPAAVMVMWSIAAVQRVTQCETHSFIDKKHWKRMDVSEWTVETDDGYDRRTTHILQCSLKNL